MVDVDGGPIRAGSKEETMTKPKTKSKTCEARNCDGIAFDGAARCPFHDKPKHTPGPWTAEKISGALVLIDAPDGQGIASIKGESSPFRDANARLISAAPDFFKAAKRALENAEEAIAEIDANHPRADETPDWLEEIRGSMVRIRDDASAAIAKAERREPGA